MRKGLFIPDEILELEELGNTECMVLAVYWYYTVEGSLHCCTLTNKDVCKKARIKEERGLRKIKKHLKDLGLIRTDGGTKVYYIGDKKEVKKYLPPGKKIPPPQVKK